MYDCGFPDANGERFTWSYTLGYLYCSWGLILWLFRLRRESGRPVSSFSIIPLPYHREGSADPAIKH
uniref:Transporter n=1 Tax=Steinernema glaseri TaxID=37863 RepID=A0A1I8AGI9_9BILA